MRFRSAAGSSLLVCAVLGSLVTLVVAQPPATPSDPSTQPRRKPLPTYFGMLGVSDEQRAQLYDVQDSYEQRLEKLRNELKELVRERDRKMETLLTSGQKLRLKELREAARAKAEQTTPPVPGEK